MDDQFQSNVQISAKRSASEAFREHEPPRKDDSLLPLTYGVEIELIVAYFRDEKVDADHKVRKKERADELRNGNYSPEFIKEELAKMDWEYGKRHREEQYQKIRDQFVTNTVDVHPGRDRGKPRYSRWDVFFDGTIQATANDLLDANLDIVFTNGTRPAEDEEFKKNRERLEILNVELISRVLNYDIGAEERNRWNDPQRHRREIDIVLKIMKKYFNCYVNGSCGLHVHVGNRKQGFSLKHIQNLAMLVCCYERQFNQLHNASRLNNLHVILPRSLFAPRDQTGGRMWEIIKRPSSDTQRWSDIQYLTTRLSLNRFSMEAEYDRAYNWSYVASTIEVDDVLRDPTIEFRQHQGTLNAGICVLFLAVQGADSRNLTVLTRPDADEIINWVSIVCSMVQVMYQDDAEQQWQALFHRRSQQINFPVQHIFLQFRLYAFLHQESWKWNARDSRPFITKAHEGIIKVSDKKFEVGGFPTTNYGEFEWHNPEYAPERENDGYSLTWDNQNDGNDMSLLADDDEEE